MDRTALLAGFDESLAKLELLIHEAKALRATLVSSSSAGRDAVPLTVGLQFGIIA
jgi:hypothetical protein